LLGAGITAAMSSHALEKIKDSLTCRITRWQGSGDSNYQARQGKPQADDGGDEPMAANGQSPTGMLPIQFGPLVTVGYTIPVTGVIFRRVELREPGGV
jgi:hypothetical protein